MFEDKTPTAIKERILSKIQASANVSVMAGSFADAMVGPISEELSEAYQSLPGVVSMLFVDEGSGPYIDVVGQQNYNLDRRPGTRAIGSISLAGDPGTTLPVGTVFLTAGGLEFELVNPVSIGASGAAIGEIKAVRTGSAYNLEAGALVRMYVNPVGLHSFSSGATTGGTDAESDGFLLARIDEFRKRPPTSGNGYHYRAWALEVAGVGNAKIVQLAHGPGTVGVWVIDGNYNPASVDIVNAVTANIEANRPIGATVTISAAIALPVTVEAVLSLTPSVTPEQVKLELTARLEAYCRDIIKENYDRVYAGPEDDVPYFLLFNRVVTLLLTIPGVRNYLSLKLNGTAADVTLPADQVPIIQEVVISV